MNAGIYERDDVLQAIGWGGAEPDEPHNALVEADCGAWRQVEGSALEWCSTLLRDKHTAALYVATDLRWRTSDGAWHYQHEQWPPIMALVRVG